MAFHHIGVLVPQHPSKQDRQETVRRQYGTKNRRIMHKKARIWPCCMNMPIMVNDRANEIENDFEDNFLSGLLTPVLPATKACPPLQEITTGAIRLNGNDGLQEVLEGTDPRNVLNVIVLLCTSGTPRRATTQGNKDSNQKDNHAGRNHRFVAGVVGLLAWETFLALQLALLWA